MSSLPCKPVVSWERYKRKPEVIGLPLLGLDGDHTNADTALGCSSDGRISSTGRSYRKPSHSARSADRGSSTTSEVVSKRMVALRLSSYFGQPESPLVAKATQAACMVSASCCGGLVPRARLSPVAERVEDEGNLQRMARAKESVELW